MPGRFSHPAPETRHRAIAIALAVAIEALLILGLLSLGEVKRQVADMRDALVTFTATDEDEQAPEPAPSSPAAPDPAPTARDRAPAAPMPRRDMRSGTPLPLPPPAAVLRSDFDLAAAPPQPSVRREAEGLLVGPVDTPAPGDTPRIAGSGPNGEPLYAARWYREPYDDELAGYLSTARGPGWGLIDCRTAADWRVEDCVVVGESPRGSGIGKAVQSAAWQFKVRPPMKGGHSMVGEWVRIRIDYGIDR